jgi:superfamily II DNA or RNA helicase
MSFPDQIRHRISSTIRFRGSQYYHTGRVLDIKGGPNHADAMVEGTRTYRVSFRINAGLIRMACTCPFAKNANCKHMWAAALAAEERGFLTGTGRPAKEKSESREVKDAGRSGISRPHAASGEPAGKAGPAAQPRPDKNAAKPFPHESFLKSVREAASEVLRKSDERLAQDSGEILYFLDIRAAIHEDRILLDVMHRKRFKDGRWRQPKPLRITSGKVADLPCPEDRSILGILRGAWNEYGWSDDMVARPQDYYNIYTLPPAMLAVLLPLLAACGRTYLAGEPFDGDQPGLRWDEGPAWAMRLELKRSGSKAFELEGRLYRDGENISLSDPQVLFEAGFMIRNGLMSRLDHKGAFIWILALRRKKVLSFPAGHRGRWLKLLLDQPLLPEIILPDEIKPAESSPAPGMRLRIRKPDQKSAFGRPEPELQGELSFDYDGIIASRDEWTEGLYDAGKNRLIRRSRTLEDQAYTRLIDQGFRERRLYPSGLSLEIPAKRLPAAVRNLIDAGWHVEAEGVRYRQAGEARIEIRSSRDWFELDGYVPFGDQRAPFPALLEAARKKEAFVRLGDGTFGLIPEEWLERYGFAAGMGRSEKGVIRYAHGQAGILDALLALTPEAACDKTFGEIRGKLGRFQGIRPARPPRGFSGILRPYQEEGLGWLRFLADFGFGGILADDMGLGKTVQVLALLEMRRALRSASASKGRRKTGVHSAVRSGGKRKAGGLPPPSLVVAPRSLVFNWKQEAERFAPRLRVLDHTGLERPRSADGFREYDLILTTYGTLRRDIHWLREFRFDYAVLDEAQAVKTASSASAKASRLLNADHRLALSGTPVENHLGELWSLMEYLNPGLLGSASAFSAVGRGGSGPAGTPQTVAFLARALRPYILRRTKKQVAADLPDKIEQTLHCELEGEQRRLYEELRDYYRDALLKRVDAEGMARSKFFVLEGLLRLRQAACHAGLVNPKAMDTPSAKIETLMAQLAEVREEGHKILVFSQFTSFLNIVRGHLDRLKTDYLYLDGKTRDRGALVRRFQEDPECDLFLISLKAGGLGLNLTAAEYVFLLDPWWNPAVEMQAIDRAHRIGQTRNVFAYRLIAKDTVEERVLELQKGKRLLAEAILDQDATPLRSLTVDDLKLLLS